MAETSGETLGQRLDKWLWYTRLVKSRSLAGKIIVAGKVRVNKEKISKPSYLVKEGDVITAVIAKQVRLVKLLQTGTRRGPAKEARDLYEDLDPPQLKKKSQKVTKIEPGSPYRPPGTGRPTKKQRRQTDSLKMKTEN